MLIKQIVSKQIIQEITIDVIKWILYYLKTNL